MREIKEFKDVDRLMLANKPVIQESNSVSFVNDDLSLKLIEEDDFYYLKVLNNTLYFQIGGENNLNVKLEDTVKCKNGLWGLVTAFSITNDRFYIFHQEKDQTPKFLILDKKLDVVRQAAKGCNYGINNYLFRCFGNKILCFDIQSEEALWELELESIVNQNSFLLASDNVFATLKSGQLLAIDISTGELKWKQESVGRIALFEDKIYCIADYKIKELDASSGEIQREESMQSLIDAYGFRPTGAHKVYDEYIFAMASGKPGMVAIYSRKTLKFQEMLKLDEMIPMGTDHLHWHNGKLYVLDFGKTLHVYDKE